MLSFWSAATQQGLDAIMQRMNLQPKKKLCPHTDLIWICSCGLSHAFKYVQKTELSGLEHNAGEHFEKDLIKVILLITAGCCLKEPVKNFFVNILSQF